MGFKMIELTPAQRRAFRAQAHHLHPVVSVSSNGLTPSVLKEIDHALQAHELIKIRVYGEDRSHRDSIMQTVCTELQAAAVRDANAGHAPSPAQSENNPSAGQPAPSQKDQHRLYALFDALADAIFIVDESGLCIAANPAACAFFGMPHSAVLASNLFELFAARSAIPAARWRERFLQLR